MQNFNGNSNANNLQFKVSVLWLLWFLLFDFINMYFFINIMELVFSLQKVSVVYKIYLWNIKFKYGIYLLFKLACLWKESFV